jgi:hypothetical protein
LTPEASIQPRRFPERPLAAAASEGGTTIVPLQAVVQLLHLMGEAFDHFAQLMDAAFKGFQVGMPMTRVMAQLSGALSEVIGFLAETCLVQVCRSFFQVGGAITFLTLARLFFAIVALFLAIVALFLAIVALFLATLFVVLALTAALFVVLALGLLSLAFPAALFVVLALGLLSLALTAALFVVLALGLLSFAFPAALLLGARFLTALALAAAFLFLAVVVFVDVLSFLTVVLVFLGMVLICQGGGHSEEERSQTGQ